MSYENVFVPFLAVFFLRNRSISESITLNVIGGETDKCVSAPSPFRSGERGNEDTQISSLPKTIRRKKEGEWKGTPHGRWCTDGGSDREGEGKGETGDKSSNGISILGAEGFEGFANAGDSL